jgi:hypothetical protein
LHWQSTSSGVYPGTARSLSLHFLCTFHNWNKSVTIILSTHLTNIFRLTIDIDGNMWQFFTCRINLRVLSSPGEWAAGPQIIFIIMTPKLKMSNPLEIFCSFTNSGGQYPLHYTMIDTFNGIMRIWPKVQHKW